MNVAAILSLVAPFLIGLLVGALIKRAFRVILAGIALVIVLVATGTISLTFGDLFNRALNALPKLWTTAHGWIGVLPYSSAGFLIGLAIGLWKG